MIDFKTKDVYGEINEIMEGAMAYKGILGAAVGDIIGSYYEWHNYKGKDFKLFSHKDHFTDDTVMTLAIGKALKECHGDYTHLAEKATETMQALGRQYRGAGYGGNFRAWLEADKPEPYNSWGNGAAMRVSGCAYFAMSIVEAEKLSYQVTALTHNHPEGIKGAEATTVATYMALHGKDKEDIKAYIKKRYYPLDFTLNDIRDEYKFHVSCQKSVPQALAAFFEGTDYEDTVRNAISIGGDSDTIAAIAGGVACAYYGMPEDIKQKGLQYLDDNLRAIAAEIDEKIAENRQKVNLLELQRSGKDSI